ncbi:MAG: TetR/AcrR family transcriptional regulator [Cyclobacteriaceae bacterium]
MSPRSKQQYEEIREATMDKIMKAALELFGTTGFDRTSITSIAKKAEVSKGLLYHYFESKEDLLEKMIFYYADRADFSMDQLTNGSAHEVLANLIDMFFKEMRENYQVWRLFMNLTVQIDKFDFVREMAIGKMSAYTELFQKVFEELGWKDPKGEAQMLGAIFDGMGLQYYILGDNYPLDEMEQILINKYCKK